MKKCAGLLIFFCEAAIASNDATNTSKYEGAYLGAGFSYRIAMNEITGWDNADDAFDNGTAMQGFNLYEAKTNQFGVMLSGGYGKILNERWYVGVNMDIAIFPNIKEEQGKKHPDFEGEIVTVCKQNAVTPTFVLKIGRVISDTLVCARFGGSLTGMRFETEALSLVEDEMVKVSRGRNKFVPVVGFDVRRKITDQLDICFKFDFGFPKTTSERTRKAEYDYDAIVKNKVKGCIVGVSVIHGF